MTDWRKYARPSMVQRREALDAKPLPLTLGMCAGVPMPHAFAPLGITQCATCYGWRDDPRHWSEARRG